MFDHQLRVLKDDIFDPLSRAVPPSISPGHITGAAFVCGLQAALCASLGHPLLCTFFWILNRALDCLDGAVARVRGQQSDLGGFLDLLGDFIVYSLIPIGCVLGEGWSNADLAGDLLAVCLLEASFHINNFVLFYVAALVEKGKAGGTQRLKELTSVAMRPALVEGAESGVFFTLMCLFPSHIRLLCYLMLAGVVVGTAQRVVWTVNALSK